MMSHKAIAEKAARWLPADGAIERLRIHHDASDYFAIGYGDVLVLDGHSYLIRNNAREGRFGLDDEVKHWVKRAIERAQLSASR